MIPKFTPVFFQSLENYVYDWHMRTFPKQLNTKSIIIVDIDEKSLSHMGRWPWNRNILAKLVDNLVDYQVKLIAFDVLFAEQQENTGQQVINTLLKNPLMTDDKAIREVLLDIATQYNYSNLLEQSFDKIPVILSVTESNNTQTSLELTSTFNMEAVSLDNFYHFPGITGNLPSLNKKAAALGFISNPWVDNDGVFRQIPLFSVWQQALIPAFALAIAETVLVNDKIVLHGFNHWLESVQLGSHKIVVHGKSEIYIPYYGGAHSFVYVSALDIINKTVVAQPLNNKIILVGTSASGLADVRTTPTGNMPGVEIHASMLAGILQDDLMVTPGYALFVNSLFFIIFALIIHLMFKRSTILWTSLVFIISLIWVIGGNYYFWTQNEVFPIAVLLIAMSTLFLFQIIFGYSHILLDKYHMSLLFGQYVPQYLVNEMSKNPSQFSLEGEQKELSILFSDVRGFTELSTQYDCKTLCQLINQFLTPLTYDIHRHQGTIDKYIGDAIMAFWGAPIAQVNHASNSVLAALAMQHSIQSLNKDFVQKGWPKLQMGIGINSGVVNVGNMGSDFRKAYTVMGDAVNLASRLEGLTKFYGVDIIVSDATEHATPEILYRVLDKVRVKGRKITLNIYEPIALIKECSDDTINTINEFNAMVSLYQAGKWELALNSVKHMLTKAHHLPIHQLYYTRLNQQENAPIKTWDGVFIHTEK